MYHSDGHLFATRGCVCNSATTALLGGDSGRYAPKEVHQVYNHFYNNISKSRFRHPLKDRIRFGSR